jgi:hypothetical protein
MLSSPEPGEVFDDDGPSICHHSGYQSVITKVSAVKDVTRVVSLSQLGNAVSSIRVIVVPADRNTIRAAAATADHRREEEMETRFIKIPNWAPNMMFLKGMYQM